MHIFKDASDREWKIELNLGSVMAVNDKLGIDLFKADDGDEPLITRLGVDILLMGRVIECLIYDQMEQRGVSEKDIRKSFNGETIHASREAFYKELANFFRSSGRTDLYKAVLKQDAILQTAMKTISEKVERVDPDKLIEREIGEKLKELDEVSGSSSGSTPEPSA